VKMSRKGEFGREKQDEMVCGIICTRVWVFIEGLGMKFVNFAFFLFFWTPNGQKRLVAMATTREPIRSYHVPFAHSQSLTRRRNPRVARLSPPSRLGACSSASESGVMLAGGCAGHKCGVVHGARRP
jgi:hypothetical protein